MTSAGALREPLERLYREFDYGARLARDAIEFPLRYVAPDDREIVALLTACLAYGRVDLFGRALEGVLAAMGPSPAAFVRDFDPRRDGVKFERFIYRFNRPRDLVAFCVAARDLLARHGSPEKCFAAGDPGPGRSREVRLRALPHPHVGRLPRPSRRRRVRAMRSARGMPPLARTAPHVTELVGILLGGLLVVLALVAWTLVAARREIGELRARAGAPEAASAMLQQQIEAVRTEGRTGQDALRRQVGTLTTQVKDELNALQRGVATELKGVAGEVTRQLQEGMRLIQSGQSTMGQRLDHATKIVGDVQGSLGTLRAATQRVVAIRRDIQRPA